MLNKNIFAATAIAATALAGAAVAESYIAEEEMIMETSVLTLPTVTSETGGFVAVYDYNTGEFGELLGSEAVNAGANDDVKVQLGLQPVNDIAVVLYDGEITSPDMAADWTEIDVEDM